MGVGAPCASASRVSKADRLGLLKFVPPNRSSLLASAAALRLFRPPCEGVEGAEESGLPGLEPVGLPPAPICHRAPSFPRAPWKACCWLEGLLGLKPREWLAWRATSCFPPPGPSNDKSSSSSLPSALNPGSPAPPRTLGDAAFLTENDCCLARTLRCSCACSAARSIWLPGAREWSISDSFSPSFLIVFCMSRSEAVIWSISSWKALLRATGEGSAGEGTIGREGWCLRREEGSLITTEEGGVMGEGGVCGGVIVGCWQVIAVNRVLI